MIRFKHGFAFPVFGRICCMVISLLGLIMIGETPVFSLIVTLSFGIGFMTMQGIEFDLTNNKFRSYTSVYGIKFGAWLKLSDFPYICLLFRNYTTRSIYNVTDVNREYSQIEIIITEDDFRKKILIKTEETEEQGRKEAERIAQLLGKSFVAYAPKRHPNNPRVKRH